MPDGGLEPLSSPVAAQVHADAGGQPGEEQARGMALATKVAAHEPRNRATAARTDLERHEIARQPLAESLAAVGEVRGRAIRNRMRIPMGKDDNVTRRDRNIRRAWKPDQRLSLRDKVIAHEVLGAGGQQVRHRCHRRHGESPRRRAYGIDEDGPGHPHRAQSLRKSVHRHHLSTIKGRCKETRLCGKGLKLDRR